MVTLRHHLLSLDFFLMQISLAIFKALQPVFVYWSEGKEKEVGREW